MTMSLYKKQSATIIPLLLLILLISGMATDIYLPSLPIITEQFKTSEGMTSLTISIFVLTSSIAGLLSPPLSDHFGRKPVLFFSNIAFAFSTILIIFSPNILTMIIFRAIQGSTVGANFIVTREIVKDLYTPKEQVNINSILFTAFVISPAIAPIIGAFIADSLSWRYCFVLLLLSILVIIYGIHKKLDESLIKLKALPNPVTYTSTFFFFILTKEFNAYLLISSFTYAGYFIFLNVSSYIFITDFHFSTFHYSLIFLFLSLIYFIGNWCMRILHTHDMAHHQIVTIGLLLNLFGSFLLGISLFIPTIFLKSLLVIIAAIIMRFGLGFILALVQIIAMNLFKKNSGQALGMLMFIQSTVASLGAIWAAQFAHNFLLGLFVTALIFNLLSYMTLQLLIRLTIRFPNVKKRLLKQLLENEKTKKYL